MSAAASKPNGVRRLYVTNVDWDAKIDEVTAAFNAKLPKPVVSAEFIRELKTNQPRGVALDISGESVNHALSMNGSVFKNRPMRIHAAVPKSLAKGHGLDAVAAAEAKAATAPLASAAAAATNGGGGISLVIGGGGGSTLSGGDAKKAAPSGDVFSAVPIVDIGANLANDKYKKDLRDVIDRAGRAGVKTLIITGSDMHSNRLAPKIAAANPGVVYHTVGIHPHHAASCSDAVIAELESMLVKSPETIVAVGETGLDFFRDLSPRDEQIKWFTAHVKLAVKLGGRPLFLHQRDAHSEFMAVLNQFSTAPLPPVCVHCFTGSQSEASEYVRAGFYIGITGYVGMKSRGAELRRFIAKTVPLNRLMIETDCPYMLVDMDPRVKKYRSRNEPCTLPAIVDVLAACYGVSADVIAKQTTENAFRFFRLPAATATATSATAAAAPTAAAAADGKSAAAAVAVTVPKPAAATAAGANAPKAKKLAAASPLADGKPVISATAAAAAYRAAQAQKQQQ